jgi:hypothetical protein
LFVHSSFTSQFWHQTCFTLTQEQPPFNTHGSKNSSPAARATNACFRVVNVCAMMLGALQASLLAELFG